METQQEQNVKKAWKLQLGKPTNKTMFLTGKKVLLKTTKYQFFVIIEIYKTNQWKKYVNI